MNYQLCFAAYLQRLGRRTSTIKKHKHALHDFTMYCRQSSKRVGIANSLEPYRLAAYRDSLLGARKLRPSTVNGRLSSLSVFAGFLRERGIIFYNPLELVERVKSRPKIIRAAASWEDVQELRSEVHSDILNLRDRSIVELLCSGMTVRELCSLPWTGQGSKDKQIRVKLGSSSLKLAGEAELALRHYLILRPILEGPYLIVGNRRSNWALTPGIVYGVLRRLCHKTGQRQVGVRDLRLASFMQQPDVRAAGYGQAAAAA
ncbi:MAG: hypothetical protein ABFD18_01065 [Syntrophomonas sp.]